MGGEYQSCCFCSILFLLFFSVPFVMMMEDEPGCGWIVRYKPPSQTRISYRSSPFFRLVGRMWSRSIIRVGL